MAHKVLVVDDDISLLEYSRMVLEKAGFAVSACSTAAEAHAAFQADRPDLMLVDIALPDGNGLELIKGLGLGPDSDVPFIFLTAMKDIKVRLERFRLGATDYIPKPFAGEELLARVQVHLKLKQSRDALTKRNYELDLRNRARQDVIDMIVHDLKAPLASIKGTLDVSKKFGLITEPAYNNLLKSAGTAADFMLLLLNDLLDMGRAETTGLEPEVSDVDLDSLAAKLQALFQGRCVARGVRLETTVAPDARRMQTDPNLLFRILVNLISNALKASSRGGVVEMQSARHGDQHRLTVADRGPGIPKEIKGKLFDKYATADRQDGSGIGLAFCRTAALALEGDIHVEDRPGGGSLFIVSLPIPRQNP